MFWPASGWHPGEAIPMNRTRRIRLPVAVVALVTIVFGAGCAPKQQGPSGAPTPTVSGSASSAPSAGEAPVLRPPRVETGPVWPIEPRSLSAPHPAKAPVLTAFRVLQHKIHDRLEFDFSGPFGAVEVRYVPIVRADPAGTAVPVQGNAFLEITIHDAYARWGGQQPSYGGPTTYTPNYPTLKQATMSGDFENVLTFGVCIDRVAGFLLMRYPSPNRLAVDIANPPPWPMWPDNSLEQAQQVQTAFEAGQQPWRGSVVAYFATMVYGWPDATIVPIAGSDDEYWVSAKGSTDRIRVRQVWPFKTTRPVSIAEITNAR
jgi:hypothetical protein